MSFLQRLRNRVAKAVQGGPRVFVPPGHFYSPICDELEAEAHIARVRAAAHRALPGIATDHTAMAELWQALLPYLNSAPFPDQPAAGFRYHYDNPAYAWGDGSILHAMIRHLVSLRWGPPCRGEVDGDAVLVRTSLRALVAAQHGPCQFDHRSGAPPQVA
jgi:hypothetical protein